MTARQGSTNKALIIGVYEESGVHYCSTLALESDSLPCEEIEAAFHSAARDYLEVLKSSGWEMPYPYNFGDCIELFDDPEFVEFAAKRCIRRSGMCDDVVVSVCDHDDIVVDW